MKRPRIVILIIAVALFAIPLALLLLFRSSGSAPVAPSALDTSRGPAFAVRVEKPRMSRPLFGIFPERLERKLFGGGELRFDNTSPGAAMGNLGPNRMEFRADGWNLTLVTDGERVIASGTSLVFPILLAEKWRTLRCRPLDQAIGKLRTTTRPGTDLLDGSFEIAVGICENVATGKVIQWPAAPLTVSGSFAGLSSSPSVIPNQ